LAILKTKHQNFLKVRWNGSSITSDVFSLTINNQPFLGKNFVITPEAVDDDGIFDVCLIKNSKTRAAKVSILMKVLSGTHIHSSSVKMWRTDTLTVETDSPKTFLNDGEFLPESKEFKIRIIPRALSVIVPETWS
jgi:diacylglycerol kinase family enzyme